MYARGKLLPAEPIIDFEAILPRFRARVTPRTMTRHFTGNVPFPTRLRGIYALR